MDRETGGGSPPPKKSFKDKFKDKGMFDENFSEDSNDSEVEKILNSSNSFNSDSNEQIIRNLESQRASRPSVESQKKDTNLSLGVEEGIVQAYNPDFELQFAHKVSHMTRFSQADLDPSTFLYLLRDDHENLLYCYLFQATKVSDVSSLLFNSNQTCFRSSTTTKINRPSTFLRRKNGSPETKKCVRHSMMT
ncbi:hypothetical protein JTB14_021707 [Gonioctena quinquepunctata]|nr:hypothetical protein JTB14_021707 [Gonioctena quinquepunctata]